MSDKLTALVLADTGASNDYWLGLNRLLISDDWTWNDEGQTIGMYSDKTLPPGGFTNWNVNAPGANGVTTKVKSDSAKWGSGSSGS